MTQDILVPEGTTLECNVYGTREGRIVYSCTLPDGSFKEMDIITVWSPKVVELSEKGIRIQASKNMKCDFDQRRGSLRSELFCPPTN